MDVLRELAQMETKQFLNFWTQRWKQIPIEDLKEERVLAAILSGSTIPIVAQSMQRKASFMDTTISSFNADWNTFVESLDVKDLQAKHLKEHQAKMMKFLEENST